MIVEKLTLEEIRRRLMIIFNSNPYKEKCSCGEWMRDGELMYYPHKGGLEIEDMEEKQWVTWKCRGKRCRRDYRVSVLGAFDTERFKFN